MLVCMLGSIQRTNKRVRSSTQESCSIYYSYERFWLGNLGPARKIARLCAVFKSCCGEWAWKGIRDRLRGHYYLSRFDHDQKNRDGKKRTDIGKYSFVNRTIKNWNQLPAETLGALPCKSKIFRNRVRKGIIIIIIIFINCNWVVTRWQ